MPRGVGSLTLNEARADGKGEDPLRPKSVLHTDLQQLMPGRPAYELVLDKVRIHHEVPGVGGPASPDHRSKLRIRRSSAVIYDDDRVADVPAHVRYVTDLRLSGLGVTVGADRPSTKGEQATAPRARSSVRPITSFMPLRLRQGLAIQFSDRTHAGRPMSYDPPRK